MKQEKLVLVTGAAGFIGFNFCRRLLLEGRFVVGIDSLDTNGDVRLKKDRLAILKKERRFSFGHFDLVDRKRLESVFKKHRPQRVVHLAAQTGVRNSEFQTDRYVNSNLVAFCRLLDVCRSHRVGHFIYASSSSVYGLDARIPQRTSSPVNRPISLYAATKRANEIIAHSYSHIFQLPVTGLRFFTVYGPWGRPDMAPSIFTRAILGGTSIPVFNRGRLIRDFTFVGDVVESLIRLLDQAPAAVKPTGRRSPHAPYRLLNVGSQHPVNIRDLIRMLEAELGRKATTHDMPMQPGDAYITHSDSSELFRLTGFRPRTTLRKGICEFLDWYLDYHGFKQGVGA